MRDMPGRLSAISQAAPQLIASATLRLDTAGLGFTEITSQAANFLAQSGAGDGTLLVYLRHTSASLTIQENADPDVQTDLLAALERLAPEDAPWIHDVEGADDMPAHVKAMLGGVSLHVPVAGGALALGTWQGIYLIEHRRRPHGREVIFQFIGSRK
jgi:secondary thiamine-phosphate synthase enzyme